MIGLLKNLPLHSNMNISNLNKIPINNFQIISSKKVSKEEVKSEILSIIKKEKIEQFMRANSPECQHYIYCKEIKGKTIVAIINEDLMQTNVCVLTYDCKLKDLNIQSSSKHN